MYLIGYGFLVIAFVHFFVCFNVAVLFCGGCRVVIVVVVQVLHVRVHAYLGDFCRRLSRVLFLVLMEKFGE